MKKTKIVCTMGPACQNEETLTKMALAGMNVARLNFSHGDYAEHKKNIDLIKKVREKLHIPLPIMLDTKGPELRIKTFKDGKITLKEGDAFPLPQKRSRATRRAFPSPIKASSTTLPRATPFY